MLQLTGNLSDQVLECIPLGIAIVEGDDLRFRYLNPAFMLQLRIGNDAIGRRVEGVFPTIRPYLLDALRRVIRTGEPASFSDAPTTFADIGRTFWNVQFIPLDYNSDGEIDAATVILENVTTSVLSRRASMEREKRFRMAQELSVEGFMILRAIRNAENAVIDFDWVYANPAVRRGTGISPEDLTSKTLLRVLPGVAHPGSCFQALAEVVDSGEPADFEFQYRHPPIDGWYRVLAVKLDDGIAARLLDVTDSRKARQALEAAETRLRVALEAANMGAWEHDLERRQTTHSAQLTKLMGLPASDGPTPTDALLEAVVPEDVLVVQESYRRALDDNDDEMHVDFRVVAPDGSLRWLQSRGRFLRDAQGRPYKMTGVTLDVTEQRKQRERLEHFARTVAHDLKAPLQSAVGFAGLLRRLAASRLQPHEDRYLERIEAAVAQMDDMIDGLLDHARATRGDIVPEPVALELAYEQAVSRLEPLIREAGAAVTHSSLPIVLGNRVLLIQILQNLIGNALKFRGERPLHVDVSAQRDASGWTIAVQDNGIGIPLDRQARLFEAFARAHTDGGFAGLGLGLALVKDAVEHHGGRVWVESVPEKGSTFFFSLPGNQPPSSHRSVAVPASARPIDIVK